MSLFYPLGFKFDYENENNKLLGSSKLGIFKKPIFNYFFVNPNSLQFSRNAKQSVSRTFSGPIVSHWPNEWDELSFTGHFYGLRGISEAMLVEKIINREYVRQKKEIHLVYKFKTFKGYIIKISASADANDPLLITYNFSFISMEAFDLYRMLIGNIPYPSLELDTLSRKIENIKDYINYQIDNLSSLGLFIVSLSGQSKENIEEYGLGRFGQLSISGISSLIKRYILRPRG